LDEFGSATDWSVSESILTRFFGCWRIIDKQWMQWYNFTSGYKTTLGLIALTRWSSLATAFVTHLRETMATAARIKISRHLSMGSKDPDNQIWFSSLCKCPSCCSWKQKGKIKLWSTFLGKNSNAIYLNFARLAYSVILLRKQISTRSGQADPWQLDPFFA
jgi:hypothetical protein